MNVSIRRERVNVGEGEWYIELRGKRSEKLNIEMKERRPGEEREMKAAIQIDTGERTRTGRERETNPKYKLRQSHSRNTGKISSLIVLKYCSQQFLSYILLCSFLVYVYR